MADGQGGQGGGRQYSEEDVEVLLNETAKRAANEALRSVKPTRQQQQQQEERDTDEELGMSSKLVKQLQTTVSVFNTLKEFSSNPLQKAIESKVGDLAAGVIEQAFTRPSGPPPKRDLVETFLNSQLGYGLGQGLGQRAPELVESVGRMFGKDKAEQMIDGVIGKYGGGGGKGGSSGGGTGGHSDQGHGSQLPPPSSTPDVGPEAGKQSEKEILLSLDPNNPEHVSAYAETQGGISVDVARKMLMIHQDEFIKQMKTQGANVEELSKIRGSHIDKPSSSQRADTPVQDSYVPPPDYADFREVPTPSPLNQTSNQSPQYEEQDTNQASDEKGDKNLNPQLVQFTEDIGKIMGDMVGKIESMNNTIFVLQNELNQIKRGGTPSPGITPTGQPLNTQPFNVQPPTIINRPIDRMTPLGDDNIPIDNIPIDNIPIDDPLISGNNSLTSGNNSLTSGNRMPEPIGEMDNMPLGIDDNNEIINPPIFSRTSAGFFEENVQDVSDFEKELQEEANAAAKKFEEAMQQKKSLEQLQPPPQLPIQPALVTPQPVPPLSNPFSPPLMNPTNMDNSAHIDNPTNTNPDNPTNMDTNIPNIENMINMENVGNSDPPTPVGIPLKELEIPELDNKDVNNMQDSELREKSKKYVKPINRKKIFTPSFKPDKEKGKKRGGNK